VIVVIGSPVVRLRESSGGVEVVGLAGRIAVAAADANRSVQLVGKVGDDELGDAVLLALTAARVGHAAVLRDATHATPVAPADVTTSADDAFAAADEDPFATDDEEPTPPIVGLPLESGDVQLALRYLTDFQVLVLAGPLDAETQGAAVDAAAFSGAHVIRIDATADAEPAATPSDPALTAFVAPAGEESAFGEVVGRYAAGLDAGRDAAEAFADATRGTSWERSGG
jgi:hypothetical protein